MTASKVKVGDYSHTETRLVVKRVLVDYKDGGIPLMLLHTRLTHGVTIDRSRFEAICKKSLLRSFNPLFVGYNVPGEGGRWVIRPRFV